MSELARKLGLDNSTITRLIVRLEKKIGLVEKKAKETKEL